MNWSGFIIAFFLLGIIPIWFLNFTANLGFLKNVMVTLIIGVATFFAVQYGGTKRGVFTRN